MCPSQLIQGEDVIIYQSPGLGRLFCQREKREGMRKQKESKEGGAFSEQPAEWPTSVSDKRIRQKVLEIISRHCVLQIVL